LNHAKGFPPFENIHTPPFSNFTPSLMITWQKHELLKGKPTSVTYILSPEMVS